jgi:hypothetical protein
MKKLFSSLVLLSLLGAVLVPAVAQAAGCQIRHTFTLGSAAAPYACNAGACTFGEIQGGTITNDVPPACSQCCVFDTIYTVTDWFFFIILAIAVIFILVGAFMFVTAGGSPEKTMMARNYLIYAAIGIIVALIAKAIPAIAKSIIGLTV